MKFREEYTATLFVVGLAVLAGLLLYFSHTR